MQSSHSSLPTRRPSIPDALHLQKPGHNLPQARMYSDSRTLMVHVPSHLRTGQLVVPASVRTKSSQNEESIVNTPVPRRFRVEDSGGKDYLLLMLTYLMLNLLSHPLLNYLMLCHLCSSIVLTLHGYFDNQTFLRHFMLQCSQKRVSYETSTKKAELEEVQTKQICQNSSKMNVRDIKSLQRPLYRMTNPSMIQEVSEHTFFLLWRRILYWEKKLRIEGQFWETSSQTKWRIKFVKTLHATAVLLQLFHCKCDCLTLLLLRYGCCWSCC